MTTRPTSCFLQFTRQSMERNATEVKQTPPGDDQAVEHSRREAGEKSEEPKAEQQLKPSDAKQLIQFMEKKYEKHVANVQSFDEFYHAIFELIEMFCEERGQLQYRIPEKEKLLQAYKKHHVAAEGQQLKKDEFVRISRELIRPESFTFGKATAEFMMWLFGAPMCAVVAKRVLPGLGWLSDDLLIPLATSGSVAYLVHSKKL